MRSQRQKQYDVYEHFLIKALIGAHGLDLRAKKQKLQTPSPIRWKLTFNRSMTIGLLIEDSLRKARELVEEH